MEDDEDVMKGYYCSGLIMKGSNEVVLLSFRTIPKEFAVSNYKSK